MMTKINSSLDKFLIEDTVKIDKNAVVYPGVFLIGSTIIESGAVIYPGSVIVDSKVGKNVFIKSSYVEKSEIGDGASIGPFANIMPGSVLKEKVKVGAFCETKNACVGRLTKIRSGASVKDCVVSENCLIESGVVFDSFNGKIRQKIAVGKHVYIGSNSTIIAPVTIEENSYICAGTIVKDSVSKDSFVLGRAKTISKTIKNKVYWK